MKICLRPLPSQLSPTNGIGRVVHAQYVGLPKLGITFVDDPKDADLCIGHTDIFDMPRLDVLHSHGAYWTGDLNSGVYGGFESKANQAVLNAARLAHIITVPSSWVAMPFKRDMRIDPIIIGHGIDFAEWNPSAQHGDYALWNKNRNSDVCQPDAPYELAKRGVNVLTTYGPNGVQWPDNLNVIGRQDAVSMAHFIREAGVYLSTTRETFGIGTLEAMACGVPIVGWNYGGTADIVTHDHDGLLVEPGDYDALYQATREALRRRDELGANARETARGYDWSSIMPKYAALYESVLDQIQHEAHGVSIIITCHNYARYVSEAIGSALCQSRPPEEIIIVDDGSTDESLQAIHRSAITTEQTVVKVIAQQNQGVAAARTAGIVAASQPYICCLDADDRLDPRFIEKLLPAIDGRRDLGIVYSGLTLFDDQRSWLSDGFPPAFSWEAQATVHNPPSNCIPSACLFRKEMWYRAGPHRQEYAPGEDAEFWTRGLSVGYTAQKVSDLGLFWYRLHGESASRRLQYKAIDDKLPWLRDRQFPMAAPSRYPPPVRSYSDPKVSVIIPVGPGHDRYVSQAIDSLLAQTMREWECIVIDDTRHMDAAWIVRRYPFVTYCCHPSSSKSLGAGAARNSGIEQAKAPLILFLDADDWLAPSALEELMIAFVNSGGRYIYCDTLKLSQDGVSETIQAAPYEQRVWRDDGLHAVTALIPTDWARHTLFDTTLKTWEEGDFYTRLALAGCCGQHLNRPLLVWRDYTGARHTATKAQKAKALEHQQAFEGMAMSDCGCGDAGKVILEAKAALSGMTIQATTLPPGEVVMEYIGDKMGPILFTGSKGREYNGGVDDEHKFARVLAEDAKRLELSQQWRIMTA